MRITTMSINAAIASAKYLASASQVTQLAQRVSEGQIADGSAFENASRLTRMIDAMVSLRCGSMTMVFHCYWQDQHEAVWFRTKWEAIHGKP